MTILSILLYVTTLATLGGKIETLDINDTQMLGKFLIVFLFNHLLFFVYFIYFHMNSGQTPGKMAFNIKVIGQDGGEVGFMRSLFRAVGYTVSATFLMIGFIWPLIDKRNQAWHDKLAGTIVVETG